VRHDIEVASRFHTDIENFASHVCAPKMVDLSESMSPKTQHDLSIVVRGSQTRSFIGQLSMQFTSWSAAYRISKESGNIARENAINFREIYWTNDAELDLHMIDHTDAAKMLLRSQKVCHYLTGRCSD